MRVESSNKWNTSLLFRSNYDFLKYKLYTGFFVAWLIAIAALVYIGNNDPNMGKNILANREYNSDTCRTLVVEKLLGQGNILVSVIGKDKDGVLQLMDRNLILSEGDTIRYETSLSNLYVDDNSKSLSLWLKAYNYPIIAFCLLIVISVVYGLTCPDITYRDYEKVRNANLQEFVIGKVPRILGLIVLLYIAYGAYHRITY